MHAGDQRDPYERLNRSISSFNDYIDNHVVRPIGRVYKTAVPKPLDQGISNFFNNLNDIVVIANDILQFKIDQALSDIFRFLFNSSIGILGLFDVSTHMGLVKHHEDFGQTLAVWGFSSGPYLVMPFLGPTTLRDGAGFGVDSLLNPIVNVQDTAASSGLMALQYVDFTANYESARNLIEDAALDPYEFTKNAYLERRENLINDREFSDYDFQIE